MLVICPPCGRKVSERAPVCPFCRAPRGGAVLSALPSPAGISVPGASSAPEAPADRSGGPLKPGDSIGSEIQVLKILGEGGFGIVYLARSSRVGFCAVKTLRDELVLDERVVDLFQKEARMWIELEGHPYIVRAFYVEELNGRYYVVMEYVPPNERGVNDLEGYLRRQTPELPQALWWAIEFCHGMEYAYSKGVRCHRDIKPANILIGPDNRIRVTDFGIAGVIVAKSGGVGPVAAASFEGATQAGAVFGTPTHMPPEQFVDAASCDARSDIYSFGAVLYQMASGKLPFPPPPVPPGADRAFKIWSALSTLHREGPVPPVRSPLFPIIARCLEKDPSDRYASFPDLRADLEALLKQTTGEVLAVPALRAFEAIDLANKGMSLAALERYDEALLCYDQALAIDPRSPSILNSKGNTLNRLGRRRDAMTCFEKAIALDPKDGVPHLNKGISLVWLNQYEEALKCIDTALSLKPSLVDAWVTKGVVLGRLGQEDRSAECYERALEIDPGDPIAWFNKAGRFHRYGKREEALQCIEKALQSDPRYVMAWMTKGVLLGDLGRHQEALQALERSLVLHPNSAMSWYNKGNVYTSLESHDQALHCFQRAAAIDPRYPLNWYNKALTEIKLALYDEARSSLRQFLNVALPNDEFRANAVSVLQRLEQGERIVLGSLTKGDTILSEDGESYAGVKVPASSSEPEDRVSGSRQEELERLEAKLTAKDLTANELFEIAQRVEELTPAAGALVSSLAVAGEKKETPKPSEAPEHQAAGIDKKAGPSGHPGGGDVAEPGPMRCLEQAAITHNQGQFEKAVGWVRPSTRFGLRERGGLGREGGEPEMPGPIRGRCSLFRAGAFGQSQRRQSVAGQRGGPRSPGAPSGSREQLRQGPRDRSRESHRLESPRRRPLRPW